LDYSRIAMSCEADTRKRLGTRLASIAQVVENAFQKPQDIEGVVVGEEIYLVQARPQQGLPGKD
jgi:phosphoenolpyruvate synthase/pyruvate phosphate dikinase